MKLIRKAVTHLALATAIVGVGFTGYSFSTITPAQAEAVRVQAPANPGFADIVEAVGPAVVSVRVKSDVQPVSDRRAAPRGFDDLPEDHPFRRFFREFDGPRAERERPRGARPTSQGSGFFISEDGLLVTNNHVIEGGTEFTVVMDDGTELEASLVGADPRTDLAVLKVEEEREFIYVAFGDDNATRVGEWVVAVGNPFGLGGTVTAGIVSARGRDIGAGPYDDFLQIDAAVNRGNSGGPTFNLSGEVVGVNTAIFSPSGGNVGIAFAVPASVAKDVIADLVDDGSVQRGWLGVRIQPVTAEIADSLGLDEAKGAIIADADPDAPAAAAGMRAGDIIVSVEGQAIDGPRELSRAIADFEPGTTVAIDVFRNGNETSIDVELGELPTETAALSPAQQAPGGEAELAEFGIIVTPNEDGAGVVVSEIYPESTAATAGLNQGDVILEVNNQPVGSASELAAAIADVQGDGRGAALLRVETNNVSRFLALPLQG
ncbi:MAG: Do family serine endopeptidase [Ahrensia sp.]